LNKSTGLAARFGIENVTFVKGYIENLPFHDSEFDVVISNGVINLSPEKEKIFNEISRVLKKGGRLAISDIVTESQLPENVTCNASLWAACIGGASQEDDYFNYMNRAGLKKFQVIHNTQYQFISKSAVGASRKYGVKSMSIRCDKL